MNHKKKHIILLAAALVLVLASCTTRAVLFTSRQAEEDYYAQGGKPGSPSIHLSRPFIRYPGPVDQSAENQEGKTDL